MSDDREARWVKWYDNGRGPRVLVTLAGEDHVLSVDLARKLRSDLGIALDEIDAATSTNPTT